jgi:hypothetical protein
MPLSPDDYELVLRAACCLAAVDGRLTRSEIDVIANVLAAAGAPPDLVTTENIIRAAQCAHRDGVTLTSSRLRERLMWSRATEVVAAINGIYDALRTSIPADTERLSRIMRALTPAEIIRDKSTQTVSETGRVAAVDMYSLRDSLIKHFAWLDSYVALTPLALMVTTAGFRLESKFRAESMWGLSVSQCIILAVLTGVALFSATRGIGLSYQILQHSRGGAAVPPAIALCVCLYVLWREWCGLWFS